MPSISVAYQWAINTCSDPNVGYSTTYREQETVNGITYYDCSSFIWYALQAGGFSLTPPPFTTADMVGILLSIGFVNVDIHGQWMPGDIIWKPGHTEMVYSGGTEQGISMGAHSDSLPLADQVSINSYYSTAAGYTYLLRYSGGGTARQWIRGTASQYFTQTEMDNNALCLRDWFLANTDWTQNAIAGMAANIEIESTFNPDSMENPSYPIPTPGHDGLGLVQWTSVSGDYTNPLFMILEYLYGTVGDWGDPVKQCSAIMAEYGKSTGTIPPVTVPDYPAGWIPVPAYNNMSWSDYAHSTAAPTYLADVFRASYERGAGSPGDANYWYQLFMNNPYIPPGPYPAGRRGLKIWQMIKYHI